MVGVEQRRVQRLLQGHAVMQVMQQHHERPLVLFVTAGRAECEPWLAIAQCQ